MKRCESHRDIIILCWKHMRPHAKVKGENRSSTLVHFHNWANPLYLFLREIHATLQLHTTGSGIYFTYQAELYSFRETKRMVVRKQVIWELERQKHACIGLKWPSSWSPLTKSSNLTTDGRGRDRHQSLQTLYWCWMLLTTGVKLMVSRCHHVMYRDVFSLHGGGVGVVHASSTWATSLSPLLLTEGGN